jgi:hypothetical protein
MSRRKECNTHEQNKNKGKGERGEARKKASRENHGERKSKERPESHIAENQMGNEFNEMGPGYHLMSISAQSPWARHISSPENL